MLYGKYAQDFHDPNERRHAPAPPSDGGRVREVPSRCLSDVKHGEASSRGSIENCIPTNQHAKLNQARKAIQAL